VTFSGEYKSISTKKAGREQFGLIEDHQLVVFDEDYPDACSIKSDNFTGLEGMR